MVIGFIKFMFFGAAWACLILAFVIFFSIFAV